MSHDHQTNTNNKLQFILGRRSIRVYAPGEVSEAAINQLLQAAMAAPSAVARDPWRFVVIRKKETLSTIAAALPNGGMLATAPLGIVVCGDLDAAHDRQLSYLLQDCSAAIENLLLCAHGLGLGACWLGIHPREDRVQKLKGNSSTARLGHPHRRHCHRPSRRGKGAAHPVQPRIRALGEVGSAKIEDGRWKIAAEWCEVATMIRWRSLASQARRGMDAPS
jgi:hypothetical protein